MTLSTIFTTYSACSDGKQTYSRKQSATFSGAAHRQGKKLGWEFGAESWEQRCADSESVPSVRRLWRGQPSQEKTCRQNVQPLRSKGTRSVCMSCRQDTHDTLDPIHVRTLQSRVRRYRLLPSAHPCRNLQQRTTALLGFVRCASRSTRKVSARRAKRRHATARGRSRKQRAPQSTYSSRKRSWRL